MTDPAPLHLAHRVYLLLICDVIESQPYLVRNSTTLNNNIIILRHHPPSGGLYSGYREAAVTVPER